MLPRRCVAAAALALSLLAVALTGCSGDEAAPGADGPAATVTPTALGDRPLVEVVEPGGATGSERRVLALDLAAGSTQEVSLDATQEVVVDQTPQSVPTYTVPFTLTVAASSGSTASTGSDEAFATWVYGDPVVDGAGSTPDAVQQVEELTAGLAGTTSELVVRPDGTAVRTDPGQEAAPDPDPTASGAVAQVDGQVRDLVVVLPTEPIGPGARWSVASVVSVDGALLDRVATYTLDSLEGDAYAVDVTIEQTYRPAEVRGVELRSGRSTASARLEGTLDRLLPTRATGSVTTQVSYVAEGRVTEVRTTVRLALTSS